MEIGYTVDERRDPMRSSHAAAKLLKHNYEILGDWPMAVSSFNHGLSGMLRAKQSHGTYEAIFKEYEGRLFKFASRNFYSEFLAARDVAKNYQHYFGELQLNKSSEHYEVMLAGYVPLKELADHLNVDIDAIMILNPSLMQPVVTGQQYIPKGYSVRLPVLAGPGSERLVTELPQHLYKSPRKPSAFYYKVHRGDTIGKIARKHGVKESHLILANNLDYRARIRIGQHLKLPATDMN